MSCPPLFFAQLHPEGGFVLLLPFLAVSFFSPRYTSDGYFISKFSFSESRNFTIKHTGGVGQKKILSMRRSVLFQLHSLNVSEKEGVWGLLGYRREGGGKGKRQRTIEVGTPLNCGRHQVGKDAHLRSAWCRPWVSAVHVSWYPRWSAFRGCGEFGVFLSLFFYGRLPSKSLNPIRAKKKFGA